MKYLKEILNRRLEKVKSHYKVLKEYKEYIDKLGNILEKKAVLEAYLKRFASLPGLFRSKSFFFIAGKQGFFCE